MGFNYHYLMIVHCICLLDAIIPYARICCMFSSIAHRPFSLLKQCLKSNAIQHVLEGVLLALACVLVHFMCLQCALLLDGLQRPQVWPWQLVCCCLCLRVPYILLPYGLDDKWSMGNLLMDHLLLGHCHQMPHGSTATLAHSIFFINVSVVAYWA